MKKFFIFLSIFTVFFFVIFDATNRMNELDNIAIKTPAQVEIKKDLIKNTRESERPPVNKKEPENSVQNTTFNERMQQQNNPKK